MSDKVFTKGATGVVFDPENYATIELPPPQPNNSTPIVDLVIEDLQERKRLGTERYGTPLQAHNGRKPLVDAYQEALDLVAYLRQEIEERGALLRAERNALAADNAKLTQTIADWQGAYDNAIHTGMRHLDRAQLAESDNAALTQRLAAAEEVIRYYADASLYRRICVDHGINGPVYTTHIDEGERARTHLAGKEPANG